MLVTRESGFSRFFGKTGDFPSLAGNRDWEVPRHGFPIRPGTAGEPGGGPGISWSEEHARGRNPNCPGTGPSLLGGPESGPLRRRDWGGLRLLPSRPSSSLNSEETSHSLLHLLRPRAAWPLCDASFPATTPTPLLTLWPARRKLFDRYASVVHTQRACSL